METIIFLNHRQILYIEKICMKNIAKQLRDNENEIVLDFRKSEVEKIKK